MQSHRHTLTHMHIHTRTHTHPHNCKYTHTPARAFTFSHTHTHAHTNTCANTHSYTHAHTCTHAHAHTPPLPSGQCPLLFKMPGGPHTVCGGGGVLTLRCVHFHSDVPTLPRKLKSELAVGNYLSFLSDSCSSQLVFSCSPWFQSLLNRILHFTVQI